jgi:hypothetical protein
MRKALVLGVLLQLFSACFNSVYAQDPSRLMNLLRQWNRYVPTDIKKPRAWVLPKLMTSSLAREFGITNRLMDRTRAKANLNLVFETAFKRLTSYRSKFGTNPNSDRLGEQEAYSITDKLRGTITKELEIYLLVSNIRQEQILMERKSIQINGDSSWELGLIREMLERSESPLYLYQNYRSALRSPLLKSNEQTILAIESMFLRRLIQLRKGSDSSKDSR